MNNLNGNRKNEFRRKQEEKQRKLALKIEDEAGELRGELEERRSHSIA
jgi:putative DNA primase/helicase